MVLAKVDVMRNLHSILTNPVSSALHDPTPVVTLDPGGLGAILCLEALRASTTDTAFEAAVELLVAGAVQQVCPAFDALSSWVKDDPTPVILRASTTGLTGECGCRQLLATAEGTILCEHLVAVGLFALGWASIDVDNDEDDLDAADITPTT